MARGPVKMMDWIRTIAFDDPYNEQLIRKTFHREEVLDKVQREIVAFLTDVLDANVPHAIAAEGRQQFRIAHEFESIGDRLASVLKNFIRLRDQRLHLPSDQQADLVALHDAVAEFLQQVTTAYAERRTIDDADARATNARIMQQVRRLREEHLQRMTDGHVDPGLSLAFTGLLTDYRRVRAHTMNVHEAAAGSKVVGAA